MSDIAPIPGLSVDRLDTPGGVPDRPAVRPPFRAEGAPTERPSDRVDISDRARYLNKMASLPETRRDLVERVQRQIAQGTYETPEKLDQALGGLIDDLSV
jgi:hypothetical protein